jgi:hypothetical protein
MAFLERSAVADTAALNVAAVGLEHDGNGQSGAPDERL